MHCLTLCLPVNAVGQVRSRSELCRGCGCLWEGEIPPMDDQKEEEQVKPAEEETQRKERDKPHIQLLAGAARWGILKAMLKIPYAPNRQNTGFF